MRWVVGSLGSHSRAQRAGAALCASNAPSGPAWLHPGASFCAGGAAQPAAGGAPKAGGIAAPYAAAPMFGTAAFCTMIVVPPATTPPLRRVQQSQRDAESRIMEMKASSMPMEAQITPGPFVTVTLEGGVEEPVVRTIKK